MHTRRTVQILCAVLFAGGLILGGPPTAHAQSTGQLYMGVTDANGAPAEGLTTDSFRVEEDGAVMTILSAERPMTPMKIALLVDNSEPIGASNGISSLRNGLIAFMDTLPPQHEIAMYSIAGNPRELQDFTTDRDALRDASDGLFVGTGGSKMVNGLRETWERRFDRTEAWPVIFMLLTDGPETSGNFNEDQFRELIADLAVNGAMVHGIVLQSQLSGGTGGFQTQITPILTQSTGGMFRTMNSPTALPEVLSEFATRMGEHFDTVSNRYLVVYQRPGDTPGAEMRAGAAGNYQIQLFADRGMPQQ